MSEKNTKPVAENTKPKAEVNMDEEVDYVAPLLPGRNQKDVVCLVNGTMLRVKRGVPVKIKRKYYEALMNAQTQQMSVLNVIDDTKKRGDKPIADM